MGAQIWKQLKWYTAMYKRRYTSAFIHTGVLYKLENKCKIVSAYPNTHVSAVLLQNCLTCTENHKINFTCSCTEGNKINFTCTELDRML